MNGQDNDIDKSTLGIKKRKRLIANKELVDPNTGDVISAEMTYEEKEVDREFHKLWIKPFVDAVSAFCDKQTRVCLWMLQNMRRGDNTVIYSQREIADALGVSPGIVNKAIRSMIDADMLRYRGDSYMFNPNMVFWGKVERRYATCIAYNELCYTGDESADAERRLARLCESRDAINTQISTLQARLKVAGNPDDETKL